MSEVAKGQTEFVLNLKEKGLDEIVKQAEKLDGVLQKIEKDHLVKLRVDKSKFDVKSLLSSIDSLPKETQKIFEQANKAALVEITKGNAQIQKMSEANWIAKNDKGQSGDDILELIKKNDKKINRAKNEKKLHRNAFINTEDAKKDADKFVEEMYSRYLKTLNTKATEANDPKTRAKFAAQFLKINELVNNFLHDYSADGHVARKQIKYSNRDDSLSHSMNVINTTMVNKAKKAVEDAKLTVEDLAKVNNSAENIFKNQMLAPDYLKKYSENLEKFNHLRDVVKKFETQNKEYTEEAKRLNLEQQQYNKVRAWMPLDVRNKEGQSDQIIESLERDVEAEVKATQKQEQLRKEKEEQLKNVAIVREATRQMFKEQREAKADEAKQSEQVNGDSKENKNKPKSKPKKTPPKEEPTVAKPDNSGAVQAKEDILALTKQLQNTTFPINVILNPTIDTIRGDINSLFDKEYIIKINGEQIQQNLRPIKQMLLEIGSDSLSNAINPFKKDKISEIRTQLTQIMSMDDIFVNSLTASIENINKKKAQEHKNTFEPVDVSQVSTNEAKNEITQLSNQLQNKKFPINVEFNPPIESIKENINSLFDKEYPIKINGEQIKETLKSIKDLLTEISGKSILGSVDSFKTMGEQLESSTKQSADNVSSLIDKINGETLLSRETLNSISSELIQNTDTYITDLKTKLLNLEKEKYKISIKLETAPSIANFKNLIEQTTEQIDKILAVRKKLPSEKNEKNGANKYSSNEIFEATAKLRSAFKDSGLDITDLKVYRDGAFSFKQVVNDVGDSYGVATTRVKDFHKALAENDKLNKDYIEKNGIVDVINKKREKSYSENEILDAQFKLRQSFKNSGMDIANLKVYKDGSFSYSEILNDIGKSYDLATVRVKDFNKAILESGKIDSDYIKKHSSTDIVEKNRARIDKNKAIDILNSHVDKTNGLDIDTTSLKVSNQGMVSFIANIKNARGEAERLRYTIENIFQMDDILNKSGSFKKSFLDKGRSENDYDSLYKNIGTLEDIIRKKTAIEEKGLGNESFVGKIKEDLDKEESNYRDIISKQIKNLKISKDEENAIFDRVNNAQNNPIKLYQESSNSINKLDNSLRNLKAKYDQLKINLIDEKELSDVRLYKEEIESLFLRASEKFGNLKIGDYFSRENADNIKNSISEYMSRLSYLLNNESYLKYGSRGDRLGDVNLSKIVNEKDIKNRLENSLKKAGYSQINLGKINKDSVQFSGVIDDKIRSGILYMNEYTNSTNQYTHALSTQIKAEENYMTTGQKWIEGWKTKFKSLTQYITGIQILSRVANEIRKGFDFVKNLDSLMTTIDQTSDIGKENFGALEQGMISQAKALGTTVEQVSGAIEVYTAYGETVDSLLRKSAPTSMLAKAADMDVKVASDAIQGV